MQLTAIKRLRESALMALNTYGGHVSVQVSPGARVSSLQAAESAFLILSRAIFRHSPRNVSKLNVFVFELNICISAVCPLSRYFCVFNFFIIELDLSWKLASAD